jgi:hypothetical protein
MPPLELLDATVLATVELTLLLTLTLLLVLVVATLLDVVGPVAEAALTLLLTVVEVPVVLLALTSFVVGWHCPITQLSPAKQTFPQLPQWLGSLSRFTHSDPHAVRPSRQPLDAPPTPTALTEALVLSSSSSMLTSDPWAQAASQQSGRRK